MTVPDVFQLGLWVALIYVTFYLLVRALEILLQSSVMNDHVFKELIC